MTGQHEDHGRLARQARQARQVQQAGQGRAERRRRERRGPVSAVEQVDRLVRDPGLDLDEFYRLAALAEGMAEAVRALNHATLTHRAIPAPHIAPVLGSLASVGWRLQQLLPQVSGCLAASLDIDATGYRVSQDDASDPLAALDNARDHLSVAAVLAGELGSRLDAAHQALSRQRYEFVAPTPDPGHGYHVDRDSRGLW